MFIVKSQKGGQLICEYIEEIYCNDAAIEKGEQIIEENLKERGIFRDKDECAEIFMGFLDFEDDSEYKESLEDYLTEIK